MLYCIHLAADCKLTDHLWLPLTKVALRSYDVFCDMLCDMLRDILLPTGTVGSLHIPGQTFDVDEYYLEDLIEARLRASLAAAARGATVMPADASLAITQDVREMNFWQEKEMLGYRVSQVW